MQINRCPTCGRKPNIFFTEGINVKNEYTSFSFECSCCGLYTDQCDTHDEAVAKWNALTNNLAVE
jgi:hypothetical protein